MPYQRIAEWLEDPVAEHEAMASVEMSKQTIRRFLGMATPELAAEIATAATLNPTASPELIVGAIVGAGAPAEDDLIAEAAAREQTQTGSVGGIGGFFADVGDGIRGVTRGLALAMNGLYDEVINRPLRTAANMTSHGMDLSEAYANSGDQPFAGAGEVVNRLMNGEEVNLGTGWLPNSQLAKPVEEQLGILEQDVDLLGGDDDEAIAQMLDKYSQQYGYVHPDFVSRSQQQMMLRSQIREKILDESTDPNTELGAAQQQLGDPIVQRQLAEADSVIWGNNLRGKNNYSQVSIGRVFANMVTEPGTKPFHYVSGAGDFLANIFMDPTILLGKAAAVATAARKALNVGETGADVVSGVATAQRTVDDVTQELASLKSSPEYARYEGWSSSSTRAKADRLAQEGVVDPAANPTLARFQETGRVVQRANRLEAELTELGANPDLVRYQGWGDATRNRVDEMGELTTEAWLDLQRTRPKLADQYNVARRARGIQAQMDEIGGQVTEAVATPEYTKFTSWSEKSQTKALDLARQADIDPKVSPRNAELQRIGRAAATTAREIETKGGQLDELTGMATFEHQVKSAAGIIEGPRKDVDPKKVRDFISGPTARRFVEGLRNADMAGVDKMLSHVKGVIPRQLRTQLADADTNADVIAALLPHMGGTITDTGLGFSRIARTPAGALHQVVNDRVTTKMVNTGNRYSTRPLFSGSRLARWFHEMSPRNMDLRDMDGAYQNLAEHALNLGWNRGDEVLEGHLRKFAELEDGDWVSSFEVLANYNKDLLSRLTDQGLDSRVAEAVTRFTTNQRDDALWFLNRLGNEVDGPARKTRMLMDGTEVTAAGPQLFTELFKGTIHMPDPRLVRHAAAELDQIGRWANLVATKGAKAGFDQRVLVRWTNTAMTKAWKPMVLLRLAWPIRVIGEEQMRMLASGVSRPYSHPIHHIGMALADRKMADVLGDSFTHADEFARSRAGRVHFQGEWRAAGHEKWMPVQRDVDYDQWLDGLTRELNQLWSDPVTQHLFDAATSPTAANADRIASTTRWLQEDPRGSQILDFLKQNADADTRKALNSADTIQQYVESVYARAHMKAGGDFRLIKPDGSTIDSRGVKGQIGPDERAPHRPTYEVTEAGLDEIVESYGSSKFGGQTVNERVAADDAILADHPEMANLKTVRQHLSTLAQSQQGRKLPSIVKGVAQPDLEMVSKFDQAVTTLFDLLMSKPTNFLSRSPAFREYYWRSIGHQLKFMDEGTQAAALSGAKRAGTELEMWKGAGISDPIIGRAKMPKGAGTITDLKVADGGAKSTALTQVQDLLFDVSKRKNASDALSIIMPFADAWGEVIGTWIKITGERNIIPARRFQQIIQSGRESDMFDTTSGWSNEGFFRDDGEREVFTIPGLSDAWRKMSGVDADWEYPLSGLSIATQILPGLGPVASMAAQPIIPDDPSWNWLREYVAPVGSTSIQRGFMPSSWQRVIGAFEWSRNAFSDPALIQTYNGTVTDILGAMARDDPMFQEKYRTDRDGLLEEARSQASRLFLVQALARFVGPAAPTTVPTLEDKDGFVWQTSALHDEMFKMIQQNNGDRIAAHEQFVERFGIDPITVTTSKSVAVRPTGDTEISFNFKKQNPELFAEFPNIAYYLGPAYLDEVAEFSWDAYYASIVEGDRERLDPETWLRMMNDTKGQLAYDKRKRDFEDEYGLLWNDAGWDTDLKKQLAIQLSMYAEDLKQDYPGYVGPDFGAEVEGVPSHVSTPTMIAEFERLIAQRPELHEIGEDGEPINPAAFALDQYLVARAHANSGAQAEGFPSAMDAGQGDPEHHNYQRRQVLREYAASLIRQHPEFGPIWEGVFGREMIDDAEDEMDAEDAWTMMGAGDGS